MKTSSMDVFLKRNEELLTTLMPNSTKLPETTMKTIQKILNKQIKLQAYGKNTDGIKGKWTKEEDEKLRVIIMIKGEKNWKKIS